jgi:hypothetical protein
MQDAAALFTNVVEKEFSEVGMAPVKEQSWARSRAVQRFTQA